MKIRLGFVSNSSSASFLVTHHKGLEKEEMEKEMKSLEEFGFWETLAYFPSQVPKESRDVVEEKRHIRELKLEGGHFRKDSTIFGPAPNMCYWIAVNEFDVHVYLIKRGIPYVALCNNDEYLVHYDGKKVDIYPNYGEMFLMGSLWGEDGIIAEGEEPYHVKTTTPEEFLKDGY